MIIDIVKLRLNITSTDYDNLLSGIIDQASDYFSYATGKLLESTDLTYDTDATASVFYLPYTPVTAITAITSSDTAITDYKLIGNRIILPSSEIGLIVDYTAGYTVVPTGVENIIASIAAFYYDQSSASTYHKDDGLHPFDAVLPAYIIDQLYYYKW